MDDPIYTKFKKIQNQCMVLEVRIAFSFRKGGGLVTEREPQGVFMGIGNIPFLDLDGGYMGVFTM